MRLAKTLAIVACAGLLSAVAMGSVDHAYAQDAGESDAASPGGGAHAAASVAMQSDKMKSPPQDVRGCWDGSNSNGTIDDNNFGSGIGWIGFIQKGKKLAGGKHGSFYQFVWDNGNDWAFGPLSGKVTATQFNVSGKVEGKCKVRISGHLGVSDDIVGDYEYTGCTPKDSFIDTSGSFDLPLNDSPGGCPNIIPTN